MWRVLVVPGLAVLFAPFYLATASKLVDHDVFAMAEVAQLVLDGRTLYLDAWDNKPPLALLYYLPPQWLARGSYVALQLELLGAITLQAGLFWWLLAGRAFWVRLTAALMAFLLPLQDFHFVWSSSEDVANLLVIPVMLGAYRVLTTGRFSHAGCLAMGAALALAFHARQTTLFYGALPVLAILASGAATAARRDGLLLGAAGAALGAMLVVGLILIVGNFQGYLHTVFVAPRLYKGHYWNAIQGLFLMRGGAPLLLLAASTAVLASRGAWGERGFFVALPVVALAVVIAPMKSFPHYWEQLSPALCLMAPLALDRLTEGRAPRAGLAALLGYLGINAILTCVYLGLIKTNLEGHASRSSYDAIAAHIRAKADPDDTLFVVGPQSAYLHFATDLPPVDALFWDLFLESELVELSGRNPGSVFAKYRSNPPDLLVIDKAVEAAARAGGQVPGRREFRELLDYLLKNGGYEVVGESGPYHILKRTTVAPK